MAYFRCEYSSASLKMQTSFIAVVPQDIDRSKCPVVFLLHGLSDNCTAWTRYTRCEQYAQDHKVCLIMPEVNRGFYMNIQGSYQYFDYVADELVDYARDIFSLKGPNYVMGLSMGGFGSLKCFLTYPDRFKGCGAFSAVIEAFSHSLWVSSPYSKEDDLAELANNCRTQGKVFLRCGKQDSLFEENKRFKEVLDKNCIKVHYDQPDGDHQWVFWDKALSDAFEYFFPLEEK